MEIEAVIVEENRSFDFESRSSHSIGGSAGGGVFLSSSSPYSTHNQLNLSSGGSFHQQHYSSHYHHQQHFIEDRQSDIESVRSEHVVVIEPVIIRGAGNLTIFGLSNRFPNNFPSTLLGRLAPEEFKATIEKINSVLRKALPLQFKWIFFGCLCCCCTFGCSFLPVICMNKKTRLSIEKLLEWENSMYKRLGLKWNLSKLNVDSSSMLEYVLIIEFLPKCQLYKPD